MLSSLDYRCTLIVSPETTSISSSFTSDLWFIWSKYRSVLWDPTWSLWPKDIIYKVVWWFEVLVTPRESVTNCPTHTDVTWHPGYLEQPTVTDACFACWPRFVSKWDSIISHWLTTKHQSTRWRKQSVRLRHCIMVKTLAPREGSR